MLSDLETKAEVRAELSVRLASTAQDVRDAQRLRWQVFAEEQGARLATPDPGFDIDDLDEHCEHLIAKDRGSVIGTYRMLTAEAARRAGGYYSQREFDLSGIVRHDRRLLEIGRSCVLPAYRTGATIALLWSGLAEYLLASRHDALIGCASIPLGADGVGGSGAQLALALSRTHAARDELRAIPRLALPHPYVLQATAPAISTPPLVKGYLRSGALVCGEPCWDPDFNCADLLLYLGVEQLSARYARRFLAPLRSSTVAAPLPVDAAA